MRQVEVTPGQMEEGDILPWESTPGSGHIVEDRVISHVEHGPMPGSAIIHFKSGEPYLTEGGLMFLIGREVEDEEDDE